MNNHNEIKNTTPEFKEYVRKINILGILSVACFGFSSIGLMFFFPQSFSTNIPISLLDMFVYAMGGIVFIMGIYFWRKLIKTPRPSAF